VAGPASRQAPRRVAVHVTRGWRCRQARSARDTTVVTTPRRALRKSSAPS